MPRTAPRLALLLAALCAGLVGLTGLSGCNDDTSEPGCLPPEVFEGPQRTDYPTDGIGTAPGQTLANHGFVQPDGTQVDLSTMVYAPPGHRLLMLVTASGWCTACIEEQPKLQALHDEFACRGLTTVVAVFEDEQFAPARPADAAQWQRRFGLSFPVVADPAFVLGEYYDASQTPMVMMVDVETMQIVSVETGYNEANVRAIINAYL